MNQEIIKLNGNVYHSENLSELQQSLENDWQQEIYHFLLDWFDDSEEIITRTSGSTGVPKEIRLGKEAMRNSARMTNQFFGLNAEKTALLCLPASYIAGKMMLVRALVGGFHLVAVKPTANPFENLNHKIDFTAITPYQLFHSAESLKIGNVKKIIVGGGPVTAKLEKLAEIIPAELFETYGMTETCSHIALRCFNGTAKSDCFTVLDGVTILQDERSCLLIKAPHLLETEIQTNDIVELIGLTSFRWLGRADSIINSGGVKIHPEQVEKKLQGIIPASYFISSLPDDLLENRVVLVIESEPYPVEQEADLKLAMRQLLLKYEIPREIYFISAFVYSSSNKVLRKETLSEITSR
jgi:Acyl-CoA synthetases (AMP-forming)/AMP-acid ligases II